MMQELPIKLIENILNPSRLLSDTQKQVMMMETTKKTKVCVGSWEFFSFSFEVFLSKTSPAEATFHQSLVGDAGATLVIPGRSTRVRLTT